jgi:hypothetical protein
MLKNEVPIPRWIGVILFDSGLSIKNFFPVNENRIIEKSLGIRCNALRLYEKSTNQKYFFMNSKILQIELQC